MSYDKFHSSHKSFLAFLSSIDELTSFAKAVKIPEWHEAMQVDVKAIKDNNTWALISLLHGKQPIGCNGSIKSNEGLLVMLKNTRRILLPNVILR